MNARPTFSARVMALPLVARDGVKRHKAAAIAAEADALAEAARGLRAIVQRYRSETPLGHQPHMIASEADAALTAFDKAAGGAA